MNNKHTIIAIDGISGSGKSSIAKSVASALDYEYLDTGSIYRAITVIALKNGIDYNSVNEDNYETYKNLVEILNNTKLQFSFDKNTNNSKVEVDGQDITSELKTPNISNTVAYFSRLPKVREWARKFQYKYASGNNIVVEGRDITTVVFPNADYKFFITVSDDVRAKRRQADYKKIGKNESIEQIKQAFAERENQDTHRKESPLIQAKDAYLIDTSNNTKEQSVAEVLSHIVASK